MYKRQVHGRGREGDDAKIRVIVADDHPIVRSGIVGLIALDPGLEVVGQAANGAEAVDLAARLRPEVVLMDLRMPGTSGIEATSRIAAELPEVRVLVLTTYETDDDILGAIEAGASGTSSRPPRRRRSSRGSGPSLTAIRSSPRRSPPRSSRGCAATDRADLS